MNALPFGRTDGVTAYRPIALIAAASARVADCGLHVDVAGEGADAVDRGKKNLVVRAVRAAFDALGGQPRGLEVVCANRIPHGRGLGSSAARVIAGRFGSRAARPAPSTSPRS